MRCSRGLLIAMLATVLLFALASEATAAHFGYRPLARGSRGEDVEELQWMLTSFGYLSGTVDGIYGPEMEAIVKTLQKTYELPETGRLEGRILEICSTLWSAFVSSEFEASEINPEHLSEKGQPQLVVYTVLRGDCLTSIAKKYGTKASLLIQLNHLDDPDLIRPGDQLYVLLYE